MRIDARTQAEAEALLTSGEWIADLSLNKPNIVYLYPYQRAGTITGFTPLGVIPFVPNTKERSSLARKRFMGAALIQGRASTENQFDKFVQGEHWLVGTDVSVYRTTSSQIFS